MLIRLLLLVLAGTVFTAATCVTSFEQQGSAGPWTGEFVNSDGYTAAGYTVSSTITDGGGRTGSASAVVCPTLVRPGERAAFEMQAENPDEIPMPPLTASPPTFSNEALLGFPSEFPTEQPFLQANPGTDSGPPRQNAGLFNSSVDMVLFNVSACAVARDADGNVVGVSEELHVDAIDPGQHVDVTFVFSRSIPGTWSLDFETHAISTRLAERKSDGSRQLDMSYFRVTLPADWRYVPAQGIDSFVGAFENGEGAVLYFDYGWYSDSLVYEPDGKKKYEDDPRYQVLEETVDGFDARIIVPSFQTGSLTGVHIGDVAPGPPFNPEMSSSLTMAGQDLSATDREVALAIFRSIEFGEE